MDHFEGDFATNLTLLGYEWKYFQKEGPNNQQDGLLIFWRPSKFRLLQYRELSLEKTMPDLLPEAKANLAQLAMFSHLASDRPLAISNCHLYWRRGYDHLRLVQSMYVRAELERFAVAGAPLIMAGDFNSDPPSLAYQWLTGGDNSIDLHSEAVMARLRLANLEIPQGLAPLRSAYSLHEQGGGDAPWTCWSEYRDTLDYLFISPQLVVKCLRELPANEIVTSETALPNHVYVSDHIALQAELGFPTSPPLLPLNKP